MSDQTPSYGSAEGLLEQINAYDNALVVDDLPPDFCIALFPQGSQETDPDVYLKIKADMAPGSGQPIPSNRMDFGKAAPNTPNTNDATISPSNTLDNLFKPGTG